MMKTDSPETRSVRLLKVGEQVRHILSELLTRQEVHDEVLTAHTLSVTEVRMSPDLRHATVFVKPLLAQDEDLVLKALRTNTAFFQREVAQRLASLGYLAVATDMYGGGVQITDPWAKDQPNQIVGRDPVLLRSRINADHIATVVHAVLEAIAAEAAQTANKSRHIVFALNRARYSRDCNVGRHGLIASYIC